MTPPSPPLGVPAAPRVGVRLARPDDAGRIGEVHRHAWLPTLRGRLPDATLGRIAARDWGALWAPPLARGAEPRRAVAVVERAGEVAGVAWMVPSRRARVLLRRLYVHPRHQGRGLGGRLLDWVEDRALRDGARAVVLWCLEVNVGARGFYEGRGYRPDGERGVNERHGVPLERVRYRRWLPGFEPG